LLKIKNLGLWFNSTQGYIKAINGLDLTLEKNETYALVGESGSGKSMTANSIMRLLPENANFVEGSQIIFEEQDLLSLSEIQMRNIRGRKIGMIFQEPMSALNPVLSIGTQISEAIIQSKTNLNGTSLKNQSIELLEQVRIPAAKSRFKSYPHELSGGMKQRIIIAMALASNPKLLIADEPTTSLDVTVQADILRLIKKIQTERGMSVLFITHDLAVVSQLADKIGVMYAGEMVETAKNHIFFAKPLHPYSQKLLSARPNKNERSKTLNTIPGAIPDLTNLPEGCKFYNRCDKSEFLCLTPQLMLNASDQHFVRCLKWKEASPENNSEQTLKIHPKNFNNTNILEVKNLSIHFPLSKSIFQKTKQKIHAVNNVNFSIKKGKTLALVGESGCGKSTLAKAILQLNKITSGTISFEGKDILELDKTSTKILRQSIQIIFQDPYGSMNPKMMIKDILLEGVKAQKIISKKENQNKKLSSLLKLVGLPENTSLRYPHEFSGGQKQRIAIARALSVNPELIICDEPTSALDVSIQAQILNLLKSLQSELGLTYLFITHDLSVVSYIADEIMVMYLGKIVEHGKYDEVLSSPKHPYTEILINAAPDFSKKLSTKALDGELPSPINPPNGCHFHPRCPRVQAKCKIEEPILNNQDHSVACFYPILK